jgi:hypothetical protein
MQNARLPLRKRHSLVLGLAVLLLLLAACGTRVTGTTSGSGGPTVTPGATATSTTTAQNCGAVHTMHLLIVPADENKARTVEDCFWQAYQLCHAATLTYVQSSVDTSKIHTFTLKSQSNQCIISDALQNQVAPRAPRPIGNYTCAGLTQKNDGLYFNACGSDGNIVVPAGSTE